jgi:two-component system, chemotaxis family, sensor kinase CheA
MTQDDARKKFWGKFRDSATTHILEMSNKLVSLEPTNTDLVKDIFRASHTLKGDARMLGFIEINKIAHEMETVFIEMRDGKLTMNPEITEVFFEALDMLENLVNTSTAGQPHTVDINDILPRIKSLLDGKTDKEPAENQVEEQSAEPPKEDKPRQTAQVSASGEYVSIAVDINKLDVLMNITSELVLTKMESQATLENLRVMQDLLRQRQRLSTPVRNLISTDRDPSEITTLFEVKQVLNAINRIDEKLETLLKTTFKEYEEQASHLQNTVDELQNNVLTIRMLPIDTLFSSLEPVVFTTAARLKKPFPKVTKIGGEIEVDKKVLDGLRAPLLHILRNAVDHGIEPEQKRTELNKPKVGQIIMAVEQEGSYAFIRVSDDGGGINAEKLKEKAVSKGVWTEVRRKNASEDEAQSLLYEPGLSSVDIITDISGIGMGMDIAKKEIERLGGSISHSTVKGEGTTFTIKMPLTIATARALLIRINNQQYAIPASNIEAMLYLAESDVRSRNGREVVFYQNALIPLIRLEDVLGTERRDHPIFQYLEATGMAQHLVPTNGIVAKRNGNGNGTNGNANLMELFHGLTLADPKAYNIVQNIHVENPDRTVRSLNYDRLPGVIVGSGERRFCFIVDELVDETEIVVKSLNRVAQARHAKNATILGNGQVVVILDVPDLITTAREVIGRGVSFKASRPKQASMKRILVVDDSITTRELEKSILEAQGYLVDTADDGTIALEILKRNNIYDLVISDIEMPHMNGFELTANIKNDLDLKNLPVIIVSSLNTDENKRMGIEAGAQAYITKGDFSQNNLLDTIEYLTS